MIERLDHINLRTGQLDAMVRWYEAVLDMRIGPRPDFGFPGAWLYAGDQALVHLVGSDPPPSDPGKDLKLEHSAFRATGFAEFMNKLKMLSERYRVVRVEDFGIVQVNIWDPDGNHLHIDFDAAEVPASAAQPV